MIATLIKPLKTGNKKITGQVIQDGFDRITLVVIDKYGSKNIKGFKKSAYTIHYLKEAE